VVAELSRRAGGAAAGHAAAPDAAPVAHVRPDSPRLAEWRATFARLQAATDATPWDAAAMTAALVRLRPPVVFALLGTTRRRGRGTGDTYESVDYGLHGAPAPRRPPRRRRHGRRAAVRVPVVGGRRPRLVERLPGGARAAGGRAGGEPGCRT
jgi:hypothetical protein